MTEAEFGLLSKEEQRVAIAKEILMLIELNALVPQHATFFHAKDLEGDFIAITGLDAKTFIDEAPKKDIKCYVCLLGSLFCGAASIKNNVVFDIPQIGQYLSTWFTTKELALLEMFFEGFITESWLDCEASGLSDPIETITDEEYGSLEAVFTRDQTPKHRVKLALEHIISTNGAEITAEALCKL